MNSNSLRLGILFLLGSFSVIAQEKKNLTLEEAIQLAVTQSTESKLADTKVATKEFEMQTVKNKQYPDLKISGQYQRLTNADVDFKLGGSSEGGAAPKVNQLMLGNATASMPLFAGFKIQNNIKASESLFEAEQYLAKDTKEQLALETVKLYVNLYKAHESEKLIQENIKRADQRVKDFKAMEQNGLIARNDLLKAQLQASNYQIALEEAIKNSKIINFQLATLLKLPEETQITTNSALFAQKTELSTISSDVSSRNDLNAVRAQQKAAEAHVKIAKGNYYPSLNLMGGYIALDLQNVMTVTNAMNFGVGLSYDLTSIFKNGKEVKAAKSKAKEAEQSLDIMTDKAKVQMQSANENYTLAQKQNLVYQQALEQANENYRIVKDKYDNGLADTNDLLDADVQQLQSKINEAYSKADIIQKYYEVLAAGGKLTSSSTSN
ncbi:TolC family protein [Flavobacterium sp.]|uniref:TolC family protein n=1 Tax=Flavobacterium sp. TaxID=239 RepID=UPI0028BF181B|nr:TolC family protein [Flavobacterium sp.]